MALRTGRTVGLTIVALALLAALGAGGSRAAAPHRQLIFSDDFNGAAGARPDPTKWVFDTGGGGWGNHELQYYTDAPDNASLDGHGKLVITARAGRYTGPDGVSAPYTSARLQTLHTFEFTYGRFEARIRVPSGKGLLPTFWALGSEAYDGPHSWPACGEIDAMEVRGANPSVLHGTLHGPGPSAREGLGGTARSRAPLSARFHTYGVEWSPLKITFMLDGRAYATFGPGDLSGGASWPFQHPFFMLLNLTVGGRFAGPPASSTRFPAGMEVDWVRVWQ